MLVAIERPILCWNLTSWPPQKDQAVRQTHYFLFLSTPLSHQMSNPCQVPQVFPPLTVLFCLLSSLFLQKLHLWLVLVWEKQILWGLFFPLDWYKLQRQLSVSLFFFNQLLSFNFSRPAELDEADVWLCKIRFLCSFRHSIVCKNLSCIVLRGIMACPVWAEQSHNSPWTNTAHNGQKISRVCSRLTLRAREHDDNAYWRNKNKTAGD